MAEAAMFSVATKLLSTIASPAFERAYEKTCTIRSARGDLEKLKKSIETVQAVLLDAEKKQDSSAGVKNWIKRVRDVLYDAEDLFDEVATDDLLRKQIKGNNKLFKKVRAFASLSLNPNVSDNSIAKRVKDIRKRLLEISDDMKQFQFVECQNEKPISGMGERQDPGSFVDSKLVIGRDKDCKAIIKMLVDDSNDRGMRYIITGSFVDSDDWDGVECWQPPLTLQGLEIHHYRGMRIPQWSNGPSILPKLTRLSLYFCSGVKCLPPLRHIPNLNHLTLNNMWQLQYIQGEEEDDGKQSPKVATASNAFFLPDLKILQLDYLPKLKGWWGKVEATTTDEDVEADQELELEQEQEQHSSQLLSFPSLSHLKIYSCREFNPILLCLRLSSLQIWHTKNVKMIQQLLLSTHGNSSPSTSTATSTSSSSLESVTICFCDELLSFPGESLTSLRSLYIYHCHQLKEVQLAPSHLNILEELTLVDCPELELWEEKKRGADWDSLPNLRMLTVSGEIPSPEMLPDCLRLRQEQGKLKIRIF